MWCKFTKNSLRVSLRSRLIFKFDHLDRGQRWHIGAGACRVKCYNYELQKCYSIGNKYGVLIYVPYIEQSNTHGIISDPIAGHHILISIYCITIKNLPKNS